MAMFVFAHTAVGNITPNPKTPQCTTANAMQCFTEMLYVPKCMRCVCVSAGGDHGRFVIDNKTGEIRITTPLSRQQVRTNFTLFIMVRPPLPVWTLFTFC